MGLIREGALGQGENTIANVIFDFCLKISHFSFFFALGELHPENILAAPLITKKNIWEKDV